MCRTCQGFWHFWTVLQLWLHCSPSSEHVSHTVYHITTPTRAWTTPTGACTAITTPTRACTTHLHTNQSLYHTSPHQISLQMVTRHHVVARNLTQDLWKRSQGSKPLSHLSNSSFHSLIPQWWCSSHFKLLYENGTQNVLILAIATFIC